ncbi:hypothetical protein AAZX31_20G074700 [Glycine max]
MSNFALPFFRPPASPTCDPSRNIYSKGASKIQRGTYTNKSHSDTHSNDGFLPCELLHLLLLPWVQLLLKDCILKMMMMRSSCPMMSQLKMSQTSLSAWLESS